ncbi:MAG TPA: helix-turn-helix domain-containing protein [Pyrinomonadaceae bacterium]
MINVALLDHEVIRAREGVRVEGSAGEIDLARKVESLREVALSLLKQVEQLEESLSARGTARSTDLHAEVQRFETEIIRDALKKTGGHQRRAARMLGVKVSTLNAKIRRYGIRPEDLNDAGGLRLVGEGA